MAEPKSHNAFGLYNLDALHGESQKEERDSIEKGSKLNTIIRLKKEKEHHEVMNEQIKQKEKETTEKIFNTISDLKLNNLQTVGIDNFCDSADEPLPARIEEKKKIDQNIRSEITFIGNFI